MNPRLLLIAPTDRTCGVLPLIIELAKQLGDEFEIHSCLLGEENPFSSTLSKAIENLHFIQCNPQRVINIPSWWKLKQHIEKLGPAVVHCLKQTIPTWQVLQRLLRASQNWFYKNGSQAYDFQPLLN